MAVRAVFQAAAAAIWCLWSFSRLWVLCRRRHNTHYAELRVMPICLVNLALVVVCGVLGSA